MAETPRRASKRRGRRGLRGRSARRARARARAQDVSAVETACLPRPLLALRPAATSRVRREVKDGDIASLCARTPFPPFIYLRLPQRPPAMLGFLSPTPSPLRPGSLFSAGCSIIPAALRDSLRRHPPPSSPDPPYPFGGFEVAIRGSSLSPRTRTRAHFEFPNKLSRTFRGIVERDRARGFANRTDRIGSEDWGVTRGLPTIETRGVP